MSRLMGIIVIGATSTSSGAMEHHNLGNYVIAEPLFEHLRRIFPAERITTTLQMSDEFYQRFDIEPLRDERFWTYSRSVLLGTLTECLGAGLGKLGLRVTGQMPLTQAFLRQSLVVDFSGDLYGDNADIIMFLETSARLWLAQRLGKRVAVIACSPGPFTSRARRVIAKRILKRTDIWINRERASTELMTALRLDGAGGNPMTGGCPSALYLDRGHDDARIDFDPRGGTPGARTLGLIISGWNLPTGPYNRWPRDDSDFNVLVAFISKVSRTTDWRVCLLSHQNGTDDRGELVRGNDHRLIARLLSLLPDDVRKNVAIPPSIYSASQSRAIIGRFDALMSGRVHGAIQGLNQSVPTAIIEYGHEPKAHKLRGFARTYGVEQLVCDPASLLDLWNAFLQLSENGDVWRAHLDCNLPQVRQNSLKTFEILRAAAS